MRSLYRQLILNVALDYMRAYDLSGSSAVDRG